MIRHVVFWRLGEKNKEANLKEMREKLLALKGIVPEIREIEVGLNFNIGSAAYDIALLVTVDNKDDLDAYQHHSEHVKLKDFVDSVVTDRAVVDYEHFD